MVFIGSIIFQAVPNVFWKKPRIDCDYPISSGQTQPCWNSSTFLLLFENQPKNIYNDKSLYIIIFDVSYSPHTSTYNM